MAKRIKLRVILSLSLVALLLLVTVLWRSLPTSAPYYVIAEQHRDNGEWELERAAWFMAKTNIDTTPPARRGEIGRRAYYEYRIAMTYERQGLYALGIAHLENALAAPASEIDVYVGNGAEEMQKDLNELVRLAHEGPALR